MIKHSTGTGIAIFLILLTFVQSALISSKSKNKETALTSSNNLNNNKNNLNQLDPIFNEDSAKFYSTFAKNANCAEKPLSQSCPECIEANKDYKFFFYFQTTRMKKFNYKMMIHYNDIDKKIILTFSGPSVQENQRYVKYIYSRGFSLIRAYRVNIEREFAFVYFKKFRPLLLKKFEEIKKSGRGGYDYVFTGYSIGGSLATLASFDLTRSKIVKSPQVFTFGALRIGDAAFVTLVNSTVKIWRIVKSTDYIVRVPSCFFSNVTQIWKCYSQSKIKKMVVRKKFTFKKYLRGYLKLFTRNNPVLKREMLMETNKQNKKISTKLPTLNTQFEHFEEIVDKSTTYTPTLKNIKKAHKYSPSQVYFNFIYYTQPIGYEIFYNEEMSIYKICQYKDGISKCENGVELPTEFTIDSHRKYYGVNMDRCVSPVHL